MSRQAARVRAVGVGNEDLERFVAPVVEVGDARTVRRVGDLGVVALGVGQPRHFAVEVDAEEVAAVPVASLEADHAVGARQGRFGTVSHYEAGEHDGHNERWHRCEHGSDEESAHGHNGEGRNRTGDTTIFSRVLYQLSYLAARRQW